MTKLRYKKSKTLKKEYDKALLFSKLNPRLSRLSIGR